MLRQLENVVFVYRIDPIDDWDNWRPFVAEDATAMQDFAEMCFLAAKLGWEGDIREGPFIGVLTWKDGRSVGAIAFKQDNNGTTYVRTHSDASWLFEDYGGTHFARWDHAKRPAPGVHEWKPVLAS